MSNQLCSTKSCCEFIIAGPCLNEFILKSGARLFILSDNSTRLFIQTWLLLAMFVHVHEPVNRQVLAWEWTIRFDGSGSSHFKKKGKRTL